MNRPHLEIRTAAGRKQVLIGAQAVRVGRHADNDIVVADTQASRFHCVIEKTGEGYLLRDLGASNGTLLNGRRVKSALIKPGDVVKIGATELILIVPEEAGASGAVASKPAASKPAPPTSAAPKSVPPKAAPPRHGPPKTVPAKPEPLDVLEPLETLEPLDDDTLDPLDPSALEALAKPHVSTEPLEELSDLDVVEDVDTPIPMERTEDEEDYEHSLRTLADSMPNHLFTAQDIVLIDPRGDTVGSGGRGGDKGEPVAMQYLFRLALLACLRSRASDMHMEPKERHFQLRLRVDGVMVDAARLPDEVGARFVGVVKVLSHIDLAQRNIVQEGHFSARLPLGPAHPTGGTRKVDFRVSFAPAMYGQKLVLRVLDPTSAPGRYTELGLPKEQENEVLRAVEQESGMVLVAGPTGSGKTSTLYALIRSLNLRERNVVTIEDPVEIQLDGATQMPVNEEKGNSFSNLLRSVLRQDPDVIMVGEIRDAETARIAMQASITGHLVFSTVHTKDTVGTVFRLLDLGVEPYLLAQGLHVVIAQRLVRQLCPYCKSRVALTTEQAAKMGPIAEGVRATFVPTGCRRCLGTGFAGRRAFFELLVNSDKLRDAITHSPSARTIAESLADGPFQRLSVAGYRLVAEGHVSFDEVEKAVGR